MYIDATFVSHAESTELVKSANRALHDPSDGSKACAVLGVAMGD